MPSTITDRLEGISTSVAVKAPVKAVSTTAVTKSGFQTIGGVLCNQDNDRYCEAVTGAQINNGIWLVHESAHTRAPDFDGTRDVVEGTLIRTAPSAGAAQFFEVTTNGTITPGTTAIAIVQIDPPTEDTTIEYGAIVSIIDGVLTRHVSLAAAVSFISTTRCTVVVRDDITMAASATFPATATLHIENRAQITTTGFTLTINGKFECGLEKCFAGSGSVVFAGGAVRMFVPQWWGAVADGSIDDIVALDAMAAAAKAAGAAAGGAIMYFPPGASYYKITSPWVITANGMTIQGGGAGSVIYNAAGNCLQLGDNVSNFSDIHVENMNIQANGASSVAILARKARNTRVGRCVIVNYGATADGIRLTDSFCSTVTNCTFGSIAGYGIHATSNANAMYIAGNRLDGATVAATCGIFIDGTGNTITGNTVETWATCINGRALKGGLVSGNYFETYVTGILFDASGAEGVDIRGNYFAATGTTVSIKISAGTGFSIGPNSYVGTHSGGAPIELTSGPADVYISPGQVHDDSYIVVWPTNHLALGQHLLSDNLYPAEVGYLAALTHTGTTSETTVKTYTGVRQHWGVGTHVHVTASGTITGVAGQKDVRLKLDGTTIATITEAAGATDDWLIEAKIDILSATVAVGSVLGFQGAAVELFDALNAGVTIALGSSHPAITLTGQLGNSGDSIVLRQWKVQVVN